jgi:two-component system, cell cycle sensor histidine kinase and response regulator CckA
MMCGPTAIRSDGELIGVRSSPLDELERSKAELRLRLVKKIAAVERFAGGIVHDFNNILTVIVGHSQLLLEQPEIGPSARRRAQQILDAAFRAANLTGQLLAISRKQLPQPTVLNLNRIVESSTSMIRFLVGDNIELRTSLAADLANVSADPEQMEQVLINFCVNARDAMPEGGHVRIETRNVEVREGSSEKVLPVRPGRYVQLSVSDTGIGMDKQTVARIFEPFFTTKGPEKAAGLGLATVLYIVKQCRGQLHVQSEPGEGSIFFVYLPVVLEKVETRTAESSKQDALRGSETILVVVSLASLRALIREVLEELGYNVLEAEDGAQARQLAEHHRDIAALLMDMSSPGANGFDLVSVLRERQPDLKVLQMTAPPSGFVNYGYPASGTDFIQKPFTGEVLAQKLRALLDESEIAAN